MPFSRDDRYISDAQGRAISGAAIWYCSQPAVTSSLPPSPLATVYNDNEADIVLSQPIFTDGDGHAFAYMDATQLYTVVISHPLLGPNPLVLPDQTVGGGSGGVGLRPVEETPIGVIDGTNTVFTLTYPVSQPTIWNNYSLIPGLGYTLSGAGQQTITFANAPRPGVDNIFATYWTAAGLSPTVNISPPSVTLNPTGVGAGASFSLATGSTAFAGTITLNTGTSPFGGQVLLWTFVSSPAPVNQTIAVLFPKNANATTVNVYGGVSTNVGCQIDTHSGLAASTTYIWNYILVQI